MNIKLLVCGLFACAAAVPASSANLLINGNFESSSSPTSTPTGWTNVGHSDGVIAYSNFGTPAYDGSYYYDFGGYGDANGPAGDGIQQTVATAVGTLYTLTFGLSAEDYQGTSVLAVLFNGVQAANYSQTSTGLQFQKPFTTLSLNFLATSGSTTITFLEGVGSNGGNGSNDPLIDGVSFDVAASGAVPEPATWALMIGGFGLVGAGMRRRTAAMSFA